MDPSSVAMRSERRGHLDRERRSPPRSGSGSSGGIDGHGQAGSSTNDEWSATDQGHLGRTESRPPATPGRFPAFAVIKSWMDEDIIEATVRNAIVQGADAVYLVDNASTDATIAGPKPPAQRLLRSTRVKRSMDDWYSPWSTQWWHVNRCVPTPIMCGGCCSTAMNFPKGPMGLAFGNT